MKENKYIVDIITTGLKISRVPKPTKKEFIQFAFEHFEGDYGMALKFLWDYYKQNKLLQLIMEKLLELEKKIEDKNIKPEHIKINEKFEKEGGGKEK